MSTSTLGKCEYQGFANLAPMSLAENVKRRREERGWSQKDLADKIGVTPNTIGAIERGETQKTKHLHDLTRIFNCRACELDSSLNDDTPLVPDQAAPRSSVRQAFEHAEQAAYQQGWNDAIAAIMTAAQGILRK